MKQNAWPLAAPLLLALAIGACKGKEEPKSEPTAASTEWTVEDTSTPAVPVTLPEAPMTNVPASQAPPPAK
ncbi:MAG: hypothetical protein AB7F98_01955 [Novosphingobium sp.]